LRILRTTSPGCADDVSAPGIVITLSVILLVIPFIRDGRNFRPPIYE
jgi:hypothetical protein